MAKAARRFASGFARAGCYLCDWVGPWRKSSQAAINDSDRHQRKAH